MEEKILKYLEEKKFFVESLSALGITDQLLQKLFSLIANYGKMEEEGIYLPFEETLAFFELGASNPCLIFAVNKTPFESLIQDQATNGIEVFWDPFYDPTSTKKWIRKFQKQIKKVGIKPRFNG